MEILNPPTPTPQYAGFWLRFGASIIDGLILGAIQFIVIMPVLSMMGLVSFSAFQNLDSENLSEEDTMAVMAGLFGAIFALVLAGTVVKWLYFALMESSSKQATLGKIALGIRVTDTEGNRITFMRATGRYFGKIISAMIIFFGYIMAGFTEKKQALHDILANCLVIKN